jgi:hypothetical protein
MTIRPENLTAVPEGGLDTNTTVDISFTVDGTTNAGKERPKKRPPSLNPKISTTNTSVGTTASTSTTTTGPSTTGPSTDGTSTIGGSSNKAIQVDETTNKEKERPIKRHKSLNPTISTTTTMANDSSNATTSAGTSTTTTTTVFSTTSGNKNKAGTKASTDPPSTTGGASSRTDVGGGGSKSKRWAVEEEKKLASAVDTFGTSSWASIAAHVPGRNERQCSSKWQNISRRAVATTSGTWTEEERKKLVSAVDTFGSHNWANIAVNVPGRNESQCLQKWQRMSKKALATASGTWTLEEEKKLASAVETIGARNWTKVATGIPGRSENQCCKKWHYLSSKALATASGAWTVEEEKKLASAVETFGTHSWATVAANVQGRSEVQCSSKWQCMSRKAATTSSGTWTVEEEKKLVSAVETFGNTSWANIAVNVTGRNEKQCYFKWQCLSRKAATAITGTWTVEEETKLVSAVKTYGGRNWAKIAANIPGRNETQCRTKWQSISRRAAAILAGLTLL